MEKKKDTFLKLIILEKAVVGVVDIAVSLGLLGLRDKDIESYAADLAGFFHLDINNYYVHAAVQKVGIIENDTIVGISIGVFLLGVLALVECWGLHLRLRWAEWLTVVATAMFIPYELYELALGITPFKLTALVVICLIVYYLAKHKELFKGKRRVEAS
jgi:uncharacterized membrane protein (DUF2068 family)